MKALCWFGKQDVRVEQVPEPELVNPRDAIVRVSLTAICGSDLHLYDGVIPTMKEGDILGHEFMGEVVDIGPEVRKLSIGDRVVVPFDIACGGCFFCHEELYSLCDNSNPKAHLAEKLYGHSGGGLFGYSHLFGGYAGGQAEYVRVPYADVGPIRVPPDLPDEKVLFLSDIFPTGYMAAENCGIREGDTVAVWGAGPVGQFAVRSALMLGAERVFAIDRYPRRLEMAEGEQVETLDESRVDVYEALLDRTGGRGPDACIDAVGLEAHGGTVDALFDRALAAVLPGQDRIHALRQAIRCCRKGGTISIPGVYGGFADRFPLGSVFAKGLTLRAGQTHVQRYLAPLLTRIRQGEIDPSFVISHRLPLDSAPEAYRGFREDREQWTKVVLRP